MPTTVIPRLTTSERSYQPVGEDLLVGGGVSPCGTSTMPPALLTEPWVEKLVSTTM